MTLKEYNDTGGRFIGTIKVINQFKRGKCLC